jgi:MSHA biogenesis protein MshE
VAQRLVRSNCASCSEAHSATPQETGWLAAVGGDGAAAARTLRGHGCSACNGTGYSGRQGVYEMLEMDAGLALAATHADPVAFGTLAREQLRGRTLAHRALALVLAGRTSVAEAMRLATDFD